MRLCNPGRRRPRPDIQRQTSERQLRQLAKRRDRERLERHHTSRRTSKQEPTGHQTRIGCFYVFHLTVYSVTQFSPFIYARKSVPVSVDPYADGLVGILTVLISCGDLPGLTLSEYIDGCSYVRPWHFSKGSDAAFGTLDHLRRRTFGSYSLYETGTDPRTHLQPGLA